VFSLLFPQMRTLGADRKPQPVTAGRQIILVALVVILAGYPLGRWAADWWFERVADRVAARIAADPLLLDAIRAQNTAKAAETQTDIDRLDRLWIEERKNPQGALTAALLAAPASTQLRSHVEGSGGVITHAILMDAKGRNVAIAAPTTDYWQGDEAKFIETAGKMKMEPQRGAVEQRHDGKGKACWVSRAIVENGTAIGAIAVEIDLSFAPRRVCAAQ
jgi:hypothetical protein